MIHGPCEIKKANYQSDLSIRISRLNLGDILSKFLKKIHIWYTRCTWILLSFSGLPHANILIILKDPCQSLVLSNHIIFFIFLNLQS